MQTPKYHKMLIRFLNISQNTLKLEARIIKHPNETQGVNGKIKCVAPSLIHISIY